MTFIYKLHPYPEDVHTTKNELTGRVRKQPLQLLFMFQQCMQIFEWNFTQLLNNKMYILTPPFVKYILKLLLYTDLIMKTPILQS